MRRQELRGQVGRAALEEVMREREGMRTHGMTADSIFFFFFARFFYSCSHWVTASLGGGLDLCFKTVALRSSVAWPRTREE